jgi:predicted aspartyl protease
MGRVATTAKLENLEDVLAVQRGNLKPDQVRSLEVTDALVDTGATMLGVPRRLIPQLGLLPARTRQARSAGGLITVQVYQAVRLTIQGRECNVDVMELPDDCPVLIGQVPLELLDWVVDPVGQKLIGNPEHGGQHMIEVFGVYP